MNKRTEIVSGVLIWVLVLAGILTGCKGGNKPADEEAQITVPSENTAVIEDLKKAKTIFNALPSPLESAMLVKTSGSKFDVSLLNPIENANKYVTNKSMALNLGIYTCDLSFTSLYEKTQLIIDYMNSAKKMADGLGILQAIDQPTIDRLEENINNSEIVMEIISDTYMNSNSYLEENGQAAISTMVLTGGWFEGLYISTQLIDLKNFNENKLVGKIVDQKLSIDILLNLLESNKGNPAIDEIILQVQKLKVIFDKVTISSSEIKPEFDKTSNSTILKSDVKTNMTPEVFRELAAAVAEIRSSFVK